MKELKLFELIVEERTIPVMAIRLSPKVLANGRSAFILGTAQISITEEPPIMMISLKTNRWEIKQGVWGRKHWNIAHRYLYNNWGNLLSGDKINTDELLKGGNHGC